MTEKKPLPPMPKPDGEKKSSGKHQRQRTRTLGGRIQKQFRQFLNLRKVLLFAFIVIVVIAIGSTVLLTDAANQLNSSWSSLNRVLVSIGGRSGTELTLNDLSRLRASLTSLQQRIRTAQGRLVLIAPFSNLQPDWAITQQVLSIGSEMVAAADAVLIGVEPALNFIVGGETDEAVTARISSGERIVELLQIGRGQFVLAQEHLQAAETQLAALNLQGISAEQILQINQITRLHTQIQDLNTLLLSAPDWLTTMFGIDGERSYLVLAQNNDEIRPSGGFIGTYGWFTVQNGRIREYDYRPSTTGNPNPPPANFLERNTIVIPDWWLRYREPIYAAWDGSWHADFSATAEMAMGYYNQGSNPHTPVDGVLGIDLTGFELLLQALGDVFVPQYNTVVNAANFRTMVYDIRAFGQGVTPHKQFISAVYSAIFSAWQRIETEQTPAVVGALLAGLQERHIMLYFADDDARQAVRVLGWSGEQAVTSGDYVMVVDANLGNKSNNSVSRNLTVDVQIQPDGTLQNRLSIRYDYLDAVASLDPAVDEEYHGVLEYRNLLQVFLPPGTTVGETTNLAYVATVPSERFTQLVTRSTVAYDSSERYQFLYRVPAVVEPIGDFMRYRLLLQKQPGARTQSVNVQISLPAGSNIVSTTPEANASYNLETPILDFRIELRTDLWIEIIYE